MLGHIEQESSENYLETIYQLSSKLAHVRAIDIADHLSLSRASVSRALSNLKEQGFIITTDKGHILLTQEGENRASVIWERHKLLMKLFICIAGVSAQIGDVDACRVEHVVSPETIDALKIYLANKDECNECSKKIADFNESSSHFPLGKPLNESFENYLEAILVLSQDKKYSQKVRAIHIAKHLTLSRASVSRAIGLLTTKGCITVSEEGYISFTSKGEELAQEVYKRHVDLSRFLKDYLQVPEEIALKDACRIEHLISEQSICGLRNFMNEHSVNQ